MIGAMRYGHKNSIVVPTVLAVILAVGAMTLHAERDAERDALIRVVTAIERLEPLIARAESESELHDRVRFRYDWLRRDLNEVKEGIDAFLSDTEYKPRKFEPLQADYYQ